MRSHARAMLLLRPTSLRLLPGQMLTRYLGVSVLALAVDLACYLLLLHAGVSPVAAAALAYGVGIAVHWRLSSRGVFAQGLAQAGPRRLRQQALFVASALLGLGVTGGVVGACAWAGLDPRLAKLVATGASFVATYVLRNKVVFAGRRES